MRKDHVIAHEVAGGRISDALGKYVGQGKRYSTTSLSEHTEISKRSIEGYLYEGKPPNAPHLLTLFAFLGPGFTSEVLSVCGQSAKNEGDDSPEYMPVMGALGSLVSGLATALEDGRVDHREQAELQPQAQDLIEKLTPMARPSGAIPMKREAS